MALAPDEQTEPFDVEFVQTEPKVAVVRFYRERFNSLLILLSAEEGLANRAPLRNLQQALAEIIDANCLRAVFDWLTGMTPPVAAMIHRQDKMKNGLDMLAMCVADRFFAGVC